MILPCSPIEALVEYTKEWNNAVVSSMYSVVSTISELRNLRINHNKFEGYTDTPEYLATQNCIGHLEDELKRIIQKKGETDERLPQLAAFINKFRAVQAKFEKAVAIIVKYDVDDELEGEDLDDKYNRICATFHEDIQNCILDVGNKAVEFSSKFVSHRYTKLKSWLGNTLHAAYSNVDNLRYNLAGDQKELSSSEDERSSDSSFGYNSNRFFAESEEKDNIAVPKDTPQKKS